MAQSACAKLKTGAKAVIKRSSCVASKGGFHVCAVSAASPACLHTAACMIGCMRSEAAGLLVGLWQDNRLFAYCPIVSKAHASSRAGISGSAVQWGAWHGVGMVAQNAAVLARMRRGGIGTVSPAAGLAALEQLLCGPSRACQVGAG